MVSKINESVGGIASYTKDLVKSLKIAGIDVEITNLKQCLQSDADIIHIQHEPLLYGLKISVLFPIILLFIKLYTRKPIIITLHGVIKKEDIFDFARENGIKYPLFIIKLVLFFIFKYTVKFSNFVIVHANCFRRWLVFQYNSNSSKIKVLPIGIWIQKRILKNRAKSSLGYLGKKILFTLGYLAKHKGLEELINSFKKLDLSNTVMIIGGSIPPRFKDKLEYKIYVERLKRSAPNNVEFKGYIPYKLLPLYFSSADLFVIPHKRRLSASGPLCRAIGYGIPILAYKNDVFKSYLPKYCLVDSLEKSIENFLTNKELIEKNIRWLEKFAQNYSWNKIALLTLDCYKKILHLKSYNNESNYNR